MRKSKNVNYEGFIYINVWIEKTDKRVVLFWHYLISQVIFNGTF